MIEANARLILDTSVVLHALRYFAGSRELHGIRVLQVGPAPGADLTAGFSRFDEPRDWIQIRPLADGHTEVPIVVDGVQLPSVMVEGVDPSTVTGLRLIQRLDSSLERIVYVQAFTRVGAVFGAATLWRLEGVGLAGLGDLFHFTIDDSSSALGSTFRLINSPTITIGARAGTVASTTTQP